MNLSRRLSQGESAAPAPGAAVLPRVIEPMRPQPADEPFDSSAHIFEVLWDGLRAILFVESGRVRVQDEYGRDITERFPELQSVAGRVRTPGMALDGMIVTLDSNQRPDFERLLPRITANDPQVAAELAASAAVTFQAFDLLYRDGQPLTGWTLRRRKEMLRNLVRPAPAIAVPDWVTREGIAFFEAARKHALEGIIAKEADSRYFPGRRSAAWLTIKVFQRDEFVIGGYTFGGRWDPRHDNRPAREPLHSLLLGVYDPHGLLHFVGEVTGGFDPEESDRLTALLDGFSATEPPFKDAPAPNRLAFYCRPELSATVRFGGWTPERRLSFPVFEAARPDVPAASCILPELL